MPAIRMFDASDVSYLFYYYKVSKDNVVLAL